MKKEKRLVNKVKRLIRKAGLPRYLHRYGPKKYELWQHLIALLVKQECKLNYRRASNLLNDLGLEVPTYSALAKFAYRMPLFIWQTLLAATASMKVNIATIDSTGMSRALPSPYYYKRIDKPYPVGIPIKISLAVDTKSKRILALRTRARKSHDIKDAEYLIKRFAKFPRKIVADSAYDSEKFYEFLWDNSIVPVVKVRKNAFRGFVRHKVIKNFKKRVYNRRSIAESVIFSMKRKFGASVSSLKIKSQRAEMYCRAIAHNTILCFRDYFQLV
ncbi:IS5 family transposase [Candidatus Woesearchaeota archaeon]|nr:IS5 family transposase [Candidatus Woesearchaeota archaeon]